MGIFPSIIMITFNVLVVRAVDEANQRRARMTRRQQRNITVTSMLVSVVLVFLICHSVKLLISAYEVYLIITGAGGSEEQVQYNNITDENYIDYKEANDANVMLEDEDEWPDWVAHLTVISHWLLILNSSSNILIYLRKDPKFKAVLINKLLRCINKNHTPSDHDDLDDSKGVTQGPHTTRMEVFKTEQNGNVSNVLSNVNRDENGYLITNHDQANGHNGHSKVKASDTQVVIMSESADSLMDSKTKVVTISSNGLNNRSIQE